MGWDEFKEFVLSLLKKSELCVLVWPTFNELKKCWGCHYVLIKFRENTDSLFIKFEVSNHVESPVLATIQLKKDGRIVINDFWDGVKELSNPELVVRLKALLRQAVQDWDSEAFDSVVELLFDLVHS